MAAAASSEIGIGSRVRDAGDAVGTVRYVGPVATAKSADTVYFGIEWDEEGRGKSSGSVTTAEGMIHQYFVCHEGMGSFLKAKLVDGGITLVSALAEKYGDNTPGGGTLTAESGDSVDIILVGEADIRAKQQLARLASVSLKSAGVSKVDGEALLKASPRLQELDLGSNLLSAWSELAGLGMGAPRLHTLNLTANRMRMPTAGDAAILAGSPLAALRILVLSDTRLQLEDITRLEPASALPALQELHLGRNGITRVAHHSASLGAADAGDAELHEAEALAACFPRLNTLQLGDNLLSSWAQVWKLRHLPGLKRLFLGGNAITEAAYAPSLAGGGWPIPLEGVEESGASYARRCAMTMYPGAEAAVAAAAASSSASSAAGASPLLPFGSLEALTLSHNPLGSWASVTALAAFPSLSAVRLSGAGVIGSMGTTQARLECVARLPSVRLLNGSDVRPREREDAEKAYVRRVCREAAEAASAVSFAAAIAVEPAAVEAALAAFCAGDTAEAAEAPASASPVLVALAAEHPRLCPLLLRHGELAAVNSSSGPKAMADSNVSVTLRSMAGSSCMMDPVKKTLPLSMTVTVLKQLMSRVFKADAAMSRLSFRDGTDAYPTPLDDDAKPLSFFGLCAGSEILLEEVDEAEVAREAAEKEAARTERMRKEEERATAMRRMQVEEMRRAKTAAVVAAGGST